MQVDATSKVSESLNKNKIDKERITVESLSSTYTKEQLTKIFRYSVINDVQVLTHKDMEMIIGLPKDSPDLDYYYHLPRGVPATLAKYFKTTDFDCRCSGNCNITDMSKTLIKALHKVKELYRHPITVVRGFECTPKGEDEHSLAHSKGNALTLESSDNLFLYKTFDKYFSHYSLGIDDHFVYVNLNTLKDKFGNVASVGPRWDNRTEK